MKKFDNVYKYYDRFINLFDLNKNEEIKDILDLQGNEVILDIGGGTGKLAEYLSGYCKLIYILDESEGMLSKVTESKRVVPIVGDGLNTKFHNNSIDIVIMTDVLHHIKEQKELIEEIYRVLKEDGRLIILDFEKKNIKVKILQAFEFLLFGRLYFRTGKEVIELIENKIAITIVF